MNVAILLLVIAPNALLGESASAPKTSKTLNSIAALDQFDGPTAPAGIAVHLKAQVTYVDADWGILFVEDRTGAIFVRIGKQASALQPGDLLDLRASTAPGAIGPILIQPRFTRIGQAPMPAAGFATLAALQAGGQDCRRIVTRGVLRPGPEIWNHTSLLLVDGPTQVPIMIPGGE